jgi:hypothetical protein
MIININSVVRSNIGSAAFLREDIRGAITSASEITTRTEKTMIGRGMAIFGKSRFVSPKYLVKLIANIIMMAVRKPCQFFFKVRVSEGDVNAQEKAAKTIVKVGSQKVTL